MDLHELKTTAQRMMSEGKGLLAMDESESTCNKRFEMAGIPQTVEMRRAYRELILTAPGLGDSISGVILADETIRQSTRESVPFLKVIADAGIIPGIKVDAGAKSMAGHPGEKLTDGLDGLDERLTEYYGMGARFAKWRAVISIGEGIPSRACIEANAQTLAQYAALCQEAGIVPIVEPEVLMDGGHNLKWCYDATEEILHEVFDRLYRHGVAMEGMILKPNMVLPGLACPIQDTPYEVADATVNCLLRVVPSIVPGIAFLSGGQPGILATKRLNAMHVRFASKMPWALTFSYSRAVQQEALDAWSGDDSKTTEAQLLLLHRVKCNAAARRGVYNSGIENGSIE